MPARQHNQVQRPKKQPVECPDSPDKVDPQIRSIRVRFQTLLCMRTKKPCLSSQQNLNWKMTWGHGDLGSRNPFPLQSLVYILPQFVGDPKFIHEPILPHLHNCGKFSCNTLALENADFYIWNAKQICQIHEWSRSGGLLFKWNPSKLFSHEQPLNRDPFGAVFFCD